MSRPLVLRAAALIVVVAATLALQGCAASDPGSASGRRYYNPELYPGGLPYDPRWED